jgi:hypothetical protein
MHYPIIDKKKNTKTNASVGNRTRANCLEGNYDTISPRKLDVTRVIINIQRPLKVLPVILWDLGKVRGIS